MPFLLTYLFKLSLCLAAVFLFYQFVLRKLTFYDCNRWYFLGYTLVCFSIPFIDISPVLQKNDWTNSTAVAWVPLIGEYHTTAISAHRSYNFFTAWNIVSLIVIAGMLVMFLRLLFQLVSFRRMMQKAKAIPAANINLFHVDENIIPFSFGNAIFLNRHLHSTEELQDIIRHEFVHVKQKHSLDIIWGELLCLVNWYNPFAWLLKRSIRQNLEFIADSTVLQNGIDKKQYQYLLLKVIGNNQFSIASKFNFSSLKKRIAMMNKLKTAKLHLVRFLFILPLLAVILLSFRKQTGDSIANNKNKESTIALPGGFTDTIPGELNEKGYIIDVTGRRGNATVVVKDKNGKVVERISYSKWSDNEKFYTGKYGELPPPPLPPLPPTPPDPPQPMELPDDVKKIDVNDKKATVTLKDGKVEKYDLNKPEEKAAFEKKYGEIIPTPPPPPTPPTRKNGNEISAVQEVSRAALSDNFEITDKKATMHLKDGKTEEYDLTNSAERNKFQTKYGKIIEVGERVEGVNEPVTVVGYSINKNTSNEPITVVGYPINMKVSSKPVSVISAEGTRSVIAPTRIAGEGGVTFLNGEGKVISGEEEILVTITKKTTQQQLEGLVKQMKEKGVEIKFDNIDYNDGILVGISGTIKFKDSNGSFSATDFNKLILSTIKDGEHFYFKVRTTDNKQVI